jgi:hypothetical protein
LVSSPALILLPPLAQFAPADSAVTRASVVRPLVPLVPLVPLIPSVPLAPSEPPPQADSTSALAMMLEAASNEARVVAAKRAPNVLTLILELFPVIDVGYIGVGSS